MQLSNKLTNICTQRGMRYRDLSIQKNVLLFLIPAIKFTQNIVWYQYLSADDHNNSHSGSKALTASATHVSHCVLKRVVSAVETMLTETKGAGGISDNQNFG